MPLLRYNKCFNYQQITTKSIGSTIFFSFSFFYGTNGCASTQRASIVFLQCFFLSLTAVLLYRWLQEPWQQRYLDKLLSADNDFMQGQKKTGFHLKTNKQIHLSVSLPLSDLRPFDETRQALLNPSLLIPVLRNHLCDTATVGVNSLVSHWFPTCLLSASFPASTAKLQLEIPAGGQI